MSFKGGQGRFQRPREPRINERIRISPVRLIGPEGEQVGIIPVKEALERARAANLDLVEVSGDSRPPVCRIMDYGRFKYEASKKKKAAKKKQHSMELKEMRFRPKVDTHDYDFKVKHIREFLEEGNKVKVYVMFRGREMAHTEFGRNLLNKVAGDMKELADVEQSPKQEGRRMNMVLAPQAEVVRKAAKERADKLAEKQRQKDLERSGQNQGSNEEAGETPESSAEPVAESEAATGTDVK